MESHYPNLIDCVMRNTDKIPIPETDFDDKIPCNFESVSLVTPYQVNTDIQVQEAGLFKTFIPQALQDALFNNAALIKKFGRIRCLNSKNDYLVVGSNLGVVLNFFIGEGTPKNYQEIKNQNNSIWALEICQSENGSVNQLCYNDSTSILSCGFDNGIIWVFDMLKNKRIEQIKIHSSRIVQLEFISENMFVSCDEGGNCYLTRVQKGRLLWDVDSQFLLKQSAMICAKGFKQKLGLLDSHIFAVGNGSRVWIIRANEQNVNSTSVLCDFVNEEPTTNQCLIQISEQNGKDQIIISIIWPNKSRSYLFKKIDVANGKYQAQFDLLKEVIQENNLIYVNSVYNNLILLLDEKGGVFTANIINENQQKVMDIKDFSPLPMMYWKDNKYEAQFRCAISNNEKVQEIYYIADNQVGVIKYYSFDDIFRHYMEENKYQLCFQILLCVYRKQLIDVDFSTMGNLVEQSVTLYVQVIAKKYLSGQAEDAKLRAISLIEFLLVIQANNQLKIIVEALGRFLNDQGQFFISVIEPFIINKKLTYLPDETLSQALTILTQKKEREKILLLLNQLDYQKVNQGYFLQACLENQLFEPMIKLCTDPQKNEFLTPLFQLWNFSVQKLYQDQFQEEIQFGLKAIGYIKFILKGKLLNGDPMPQTTYMTVIEMMIVWIFDYQNLKRLINIHPNAGFEILYQIFQLTTVHLIEFSHKENMQVIDEVVKEYLNPSYKLTFNQYDQYIKTQTQIKLTGKENSTIEAAYSYFLLRLILILKLKTEFDEMMQVLLFFAFNRSFLFYIDYRAYAEVVDKHELFILEHHQNHSDIIEYFQQKLMLKLCMILDDQADTTERKDSIWKLNKLEVLSRIPLVQSYLLTKDKEYIKPIDAFLKSQNPLIQKTVFRYLISSLNILKIQDQNQFLRLNQEIFNKLHDFINMDIKKTRDLIFIYQRYNESSVLEKLSSTPEIQLNYVETSIQTDLAQGIKVENEVIKLLFKLLCKLKPNQVLKYLKTTEYPIDDVLVICKQNNNLESISYLYERTGQILESIQIQLKLLNMLVEQSIVKLNNFELDIQEDFDTINKKVDEIVFICKKNNQFDGSEDNWYLVLDSLLKMIEQSDQDQTQALKDIIIKRVGQLFEDIAQYSSLELFANSIKDQYNQLKIKQYQYNFNRILNNLYYQINFLQNIKIIVNGCYYNEYTYLNYERSKGYQNEGYCDMCNQVIKYAGALFFCGHIFHESCLKSNYCQVCIKSEISFLEQVVHRQKQKMNKLIGQATNAQQDEIHEKLKILEKKNEEDYQQARKNSIIQQMKSFDVQNQIKKNELLDQIKPEKRDSVRIKVIYGK